MYRYSPQIQCNVAQHWHMLLQVHARKSQILKGSIDNGQRNVLELCVGGVQHSHARQVVRFGGKAQGAASNAVCVSHSPVNPELVMATRSPGEPTGFPEAAPAPATSSATTTTAIEHRRVMVATWIDSDLAGCTNHMALYIRQCRFETRQQQRHIFSHPSHLPS